jgi:hypothetical protein
MVRKAEEDWQQASHILHNRRNRRANLRKTGGGGTVFGLNRL